ncbi:MAG TPA: FHA domain-containing protein [Phototrophicaceae bacterium]|nr:FHA domain-containing protein [Phototrophicaceae bacterium]
MLRLIMRRGPTPGAVYALEADEITIGRGNKSTIVIRDNEVSRDHCRLVRLTGSYEVYDLNSSNGTFVNGQRVTAPWPLQEGALIELGDTITLEYGSQDTDTLPSGDAADEETEPAAYYSLMMVKGPAVGYIYPLEGKTLAIGRDLANDIVIQDPEVSRYHLRLHFSQQGYWIEDLRSTNGTYINSEPLHERQCLEPNDILKLGTMIQLQYLVREEPTEGIENDTPTHRPTEFEFDKDTTLANVFKVDPTRRTLSARSTGLEPGTLRDHLMIVYAREDWESLVAPLLVRLQDTRLNVWVDQYLTPSSDEWRTAIEQALSECWLMVVVVSPESLNSNIIKLMYRLFLREKKPVIPLVCDATQTLPGELNRLRSILYDQDNTPRSFHKLIFEIMQLHQQQ